MNEAHAAKEYWSTTDFQQKTYGDHPPFYIRAIRRVIESLQVSSVFEFGCNAGRNLEYLRSSVARKLRLTGIDVNRSSIEFGQKEWELDLQLGDDQTLKSRPPNSEELVFTVSVLDHIPTIDDCLRDLARISARYLLTVEPVPEMTLDYLESFKTEGAIAASVTTETPYSYTHPLAALIPAAGFVERLQLPMPTYRKNFGPLYQLSLWEKNGPGLTPNSIDWTKLLRELQFEAVLMTISLNEQLKRVSQDREKFSQIAYKLKKDLAARR